LKSSKEIKNAMGIRWCNFAEKIQNSTNEYRLVDLWGFRSLKNAYTAEGGIPEIKRKLLKRLVGERGFEPPTPLVPNQIWAYIEKR
jgi:hypothetical protein